MKWNAAYSELTWQKQPCSVLFSCWGEQGTHFQLFRIVRPRVSGSKVGGGLPGALHFGSGILWRVGSPLAPSLWVFLNEPWRLGPLGTTEKTLLRAGCKMVPKPASRVVGGQHTADTVHGFSFVHSLFTPPPTSFSTPTPFITPRALLPQISCHPRRPWPNVT